MAKLRAHERIDVHHAGQRHQAGDAGIDGGAHHADGAAHAVAGVRDRADAPCDKGVDDAAEVGHFFAGDRLLEAAFRAPIACKRHAQGRQPGLR